MNDELTTQLARCRDILEPALVEHLPRATRRGAERLNRATHAAVFPGGKRWRPALTLLGGLTTGAALRDLVPAACAVEYVHTASLIFDDLPSMDDARVRRGRDALHLLYGEDIALLAALALLNRSYELFLQPVAGRNETSAATVAVAAAQAIGVDGMIGGQAADLDAKHGVLATRQQKTTALVRLAVTAGAMANGARGEDIDALGRFGECLGAAYQIQDDLLDVSGDPLAAGKTLGQDARHCRPAWPVQMTPAAAVQAAQQQIDNAREAIAGHFGDRPAARHLVQFATHIVAPASLVGGAAV